MNKRKMFWISMFSGAIGAGFGTAAGSNFISINIVVGIVVSLLAAWTIDGFWK